MTDLHILIVDDEPLAIDVVATFLSRLDIGNIIRCDNGIEAFRLLREKQFDLLFLDIEMPMLNGIDLLKHLSQKPAVVITTAYRDYAVEGFELEVVDYLVKPFSFPRFLQAMEKATRLQTPKPPSSTTSSSPPSSSAPAPGVTPLQQVSTIILKADRQLIRVPIADIRYIESKKDYILVNAMHGEWLCHQSLSGITDQLPADKFLRIHRSFTVSLDKIDLYRDSCVHIHGRQIPVSRENRQELRRRLAP